MGRSQHVALIAVVTLLLGVSACSRAERAEQVEVGGEDGSELLARLDPARSHPELHDLGDGRLVLIAVPRAGDGVRSSSSLPDGDWGPAVEIEGSAGAQEVQSLAFGADELVVAAIFCGHAGLEGCRGGDATVRTWHLGTGGRWRDGPMLDPGWPADEVAEVDVAFTFRVDRGRPSIRMWAEAVIDPVTWVLSSDGTEAAAVTPEDASADQTCPTAAGEVTLRPRRVSDGFGDGWVGVEGFEPPASSYEVLHAAGSDRAQLLGTVHLVNERSFGCTPDGASFATVDGLSVADDRGLRHLADLRFGDGDGPLRLAPGSRGRLYTAAPGGRLGSNVAQLVGLTADGNPQSGSHELEPGEQVIGGALHADGRATLLLERQTLVRGREATDGERPPIDVGVEDEISHRLVVVQLAPV